jgi:hypothetical protein
MKKFISRLKNLLTEWRIARAVGRIRVKERAGRLYLLVGGTAFSELDDGLMAEDVLSLADEARNAAARYISDKSNDIK